MNDLFIYGKLNKEIEKVTYDSGTEPGDLVEIEVDQQNREIRAVCNPDTKIKKNSENLITSGAVYDAIVEYIGAALNTPV